MAAEAEPLHLIVLGVGGVGKSAITISFTQGVFKEAYNPTLQDFFNKQTMVDSEVVDLEILDTAGQEQISGVQDQYIKKSDGYLLVYSVTDRSSFNDITEILENILRVKDAASADGLPILLVGNKIDLDRAVTTEMGETLAAKLKVAFLELSAKNHTNIDEAFAKLAHLAYAKKREHKHEKKHKGKKDDKKKHNEEEHQPQKDDTVYQLVVLGAGGVGKSAMTVQYTSHKFVDVYDPTIEATFKTQAKIDNEVIEVEILDTAGTDQISSMRDVYIKKGHGFMLVYSITSRATFETAHALYDEIIKIKDSPNAADIPLILVGSKADLASERVVSSAEGHSMANKFHCAFIENSAKNDINVGDTFEKVLRMILAKRPQHPHEREKCLMM